ncbi:MAG: hypothetical protein IH591_19925, partial [Bacteroidales bacterium]|nr:hypothetical protein [Bacteroidales bacterium]
LNISISGGSQTYTINYSINDIAQPALYNYVSEASLSTGVLASGTYTYSLTSVIDENGCPVLDLGDPVTVTVLDETFTPETSNKALVIINTGSEDYPDYNLYIKSYLQNFGIPFDTVDVSTQTLYPLTNYSVIIFGHRNVYDDNYPLDDIELALENGVGIYSFDSHLFDYNSAFNTTITPISQTVNNIDINNVDHYITLLHDPTILFNTGSNEFGLHSPLSVTHNSILNGGLDLVQVTNVATIPLLQVSSYGTGKIVKWSNNDWIKEDYLGPVYGMDDLIWRGIVWAAKKPFIMKGMPHMITMRVDDVNSSGIMGDYQWAEIANEFGIIPWCGLMIYEPQAVSTMKSLIDNAKMTAAPHAFFADNEEGTGFIYFNHSNLSGFDPAQRTLEAKQYFDDNELQMSKYLVAHYYEISSEAIEAIDEIGIDYLGTIIPLDYLSNIPTTPWINCGPFRVGRNGIANQPVERPIYYAGEVSFNVENIDYEFFNCITEIRDEGSTDWYVSNDVGSSVYYGVRRLRRALNSMILPTLFTHFYYIDDITPENWTSILTQVVGQIEGEYDDIEYKSIDDAIKYIIARDNITITDVNTDDEYYFVSYEGNNDMDTEFYLFTENVSGEILSTIKSLPMITAGDGTVTVTFLK